MNDQPNPALQADLLDPNLSSNQIYLQPAPNDEQENGPGISLDNIRNNLNYNIKFCVLILLMYFGKLAASIVVLIKTSDCKDVKSTWVILMIIHDAVESLSIFAMISVALKIRSGPTNALASTENQHSQDQRPNRGQNQSEPRNYNNNPNFGLDLEQNPGQRPRFDTTALVLAREIRTRKRFIDGITVLNKLYYFGIFIFGQVLLYFYFNRTACGYNKLMWDLMLSYIILGYVWIFWPLLLAVLVCFCLPCLPCIIYILMLFFGKSGQVAASKDVIKKLPVQKYNGDLPGEHECPICIAEYKEGENIVTLPCNNLHHFHEGCIKHWLEINGECPLCRTKINDVSRRESES